MALKKVYIGSVGPFLYDDADLVEDPDGDFSGSSRQGMLTDGGLQTTKTPTDDDDILRKQDVPNLGDGDQLDITWDPSNYTPDASIAEADDVDDLAAHLKGIDDEFGTGDSGVFTVVTALQDNAGTIEYKTRSLTFTSGKLTTLGAESGWTSA